MVVGHFRRVKHLFALLQRLSPEGFDQFCVGGFACERGLEKTVHRGRTLRIDVVGEECRVYTGVGGELFLVQRLDELERRVSGETKLLVAVNL